MGSSSQVADDDAARLAAAKPSARNSLAGYVFSADEEAALHLGRRSWRGGEIKLNGTALLDMRAGLGAVVLPAARASGGHGAPSLFDFFRGVRIVGFDDPALLFCASARRWRSRPPVVRRAQRLGAEPRAPVRTFVQAQASSAIFLLAGALAALVWANVAVDATRRLDDHLVDPAWATGRSSRTCGTGSTTG